MDLEKQLLDCGLREVVDILKENQLLEEELVEILYKDENELKQIIKKLPTRLKFKKFMNERHQLSTTCDVTDVAEAENIESVVPETPFTLSDSASTSSTPTVVSFLVAPSLSDEPSSLLQVTEPSPKKIKIADDTDFDLKTLLNESVIGRAIISYYNAKEELSTICQSYLVHIIVQYFLNIEPFRRLNNSDFEKISRIIEQTFPTETKDLYYIPPVKKRNSRDGKSGISKGKLVDKYRNTLTFLRAAKSLELNTKTESQVSDNSIEEADVNEDLIWLKNNTEPWDEVKIKWAKTFNLRIHMINKKDVELSYILEEFPIINTPLGYTLVDYDAKEKFGIHQQLFLNFDIYFMKLVELRRNFLGHGDLLLLDVLSSGKLSENSKQYLQIIILVSLLPCKTFKRGQDKWVPTTVEIKDGIITLAKTAADVANIIEQKKKKNEKYGLPTLPFVIVQGPMYEQLQKIYVSFNEIVYEISTVLRAIDVCFKLTHTLNLKYAFECEHVWLFLQLSMYGMKTKYDSIPNIINIANKVSRNIN